MSTVGLLLAQAPQLAQLPGAPLPADTVSLGEAVAFWILGPLALAGGLGMIFARNAVHSALWLVLTMLCLGALYMVQQAPFLGFVQIIVYTGAIMMLFLFVLMLVGKDSVDSVVEVLRGQRIAAALAGIGLMLLLVTSIGRALAGVPSVGLNAINTTGGGNVLNIGRQLFTDYIFPFELTSALLITAALGGMVLAFTSREGKLSQRQQVEARVRSGRSSTLPGPGVFATANSVATPALLPDGSVAEQSLFDIIESTARERLDEDVHSIADAGSDLGARALRGPVPPVGSDQEAVGVLPEEWAEGSDHDAGHGESDDRESDQESSGHEASGQEGSEVQR